MNFITFFSILLFIYILYHIIRILFTASTNILSDMFKVIFQLLFYGFIFGVFAVGVFGIIK